jgi:uncharacterized protein involved in exopolysaccharide biosynthesis
MLSLSDLAEIVAKQFWRMALVGVVCAGAAAYGLLSAPDVFEARTVLLYKLGREYIYVPETGETTQGVRAPDPGDLQQIVAAEMQIVANRELHRSVLERVGLERLFPDLVGVEGAVDLASDALRGMVSVSLIPNTLMVDMRVRHTDPQIAADVANTLVEVYLTRRSTVFAQRDSAYFRDRLEAAIAGSAEVEANIRTLLGGRDVLTFETERAILVARQTAFQTQIAEAEAEMSGLTARRETTRDLVAGMPETVVEYRVVDRNPARAAVEARTLTLEAERDAATQSLGAGHPTVRALSREIEALQRAIDAEPEEIETGGRIAANPRRAQAASTLAEVEGRIAELERRLSHLREELERNRAALAAAAALDPQLERLQSAARNQRDRIAEFDARLRDSEAEELRGFTPDGSVRVLERAVPPLNDIGTPKTVRLAAALVFGAIMGLGAGLAGHFLKPTAVTAGMLERRLGGAPVLAEIGRRPARRAAADYVG